jgi:hypothetical protein
MAASIKRRGPLVEAEEGTMVEEEGEKLRHVLHLLCMSFRACRSATYHFVTLSRLDFRMHNSAAVNLTDGGGGGGASYGGGCDPGTFISYAGCLT